MTLKSGRHLTTLMKEKGASNLEIAKYKLQALKNVEYLYTKEEYGLELTKRQNDLIEAQLQYRKDLVGVFQKAQSAHSRCRGYQRVG